MDPIRTLIVDDEPPARENLRIRLRGAPDFQVVGECGSGREAIAAITAQQPDLVFLDIRMPDMDGFAALQAIAPELQPVVVFVTAFDRYALDAFRAHALDYLLKPFDEERFAETLDACRRRVAEARRGGGLGPGGDAAPLEGELRDPARGGHEACFERLVVRSRGRVLFLSVDSLDWVEACGDYVSLHAGEKSWLLRRTMNEMEARLDPKAFARINRSAIVRLDRVLELVPASRGEHVVRLAGGRELRLTRSYRERLEARLGDRL